MTQTKSHILSAIIEHLKSSPTFKSIGLEQYRILLEKSAAAFKQPPDLRIEPVCINHIDAQWLIPKDHIENRIIMYTHGGGYIAGSIQSHRNIASRTALACQAKALIFNYRLAPEHPFPQGLDDVQTVYQWLANTFHDTCSITLIGDSAGAGLTLALISLLLQKNDPLPACSVLISPWIDLECKNRSFVDNQNKDPMLCHDILTEIARLYSDKDLSNPLISPVNNDFSGICPVLIQTGENEILLDDAKILAKKISSTNGTVQLEIWENMFHVWHYFARYLIEGRQAIQHISDFVKANS